MCGWTGGGGRGKHIYIICKSRPAASHQAQKHKSTQTHKKTPIKENKRTPTRLRKQTIANNSKQSQVNSRKRKNPRRACSKARRGKTKLKKFFKMTV